MEAETEAKEILFVKNNSGEGPGLLEYLAKESGISFRIVDLNLTSGIENIEQYGAVVVLGGPDSANDQSQKIQYELALIRRIAEQGIPYLGICLGLQTLVKANGGEVVKCSTKETGFRDESGIFYTVELTETGRQDPIFNGMKDSFNVFQLHGETVIPSHTMELLASGRLCHNQIVKTGLRSYGIQCHFELTSEMLRDWVNEDADLQNQNKLLLFSDYESIKEEYELTCRQLFSNFLGIAGFKTSMQKKK